MCEPWQDPPQDHSKGLVHGTGTPIAVQGSRAPLETGNRDNCWLITWWAKEQKIIPPPFRVVRVRN